MSNLWACSACGAPGEGTIFTQLFFDSGIPKEHPVDEENPYAVPESVSGFAPPVAVAGLPPDRFYVDGNLIMCGKSVVLPPICIITGETEDVVLIKKTVTWVSKWIYITLLAGVLILLIVYLILRKECKTSYYLSWRLRNRQRWMTFGAFVGFFVGFGLIITGVVNSQVPEILVPLGLISLIASLVLLFLGKPPLKAVRQENGVKFWLKGFKQPFFDKLRVMYANGE